MKLNHIFTKVLSEGASRNPNLNDVVYIIDNQKIIIYEVTAVNNNEKKIKVNYFGSENVEKRGFVLSFDDYYKLRHEPGTPVVYDMEDRQVSGEVVYKNGEKKISLYKDDNYSGDKKRYINPDWSKVFTFTEINKSQK